MHLPLLYCASARRQTSVNSADKSACKTRKHNTVPAGLMVILLLVQAKIVSDGLPGFEYHPSGYNRAHVKRDGLPSAVYKPLYAVSVTVAALTSLYNCGL